MKLINGLSIVALAAVSLACEVVEDPENRVVWEPEFNQVAAVEYEGGPPMADTSCVDDGAIIRNHTYDEAGRPLRTDLYIGGAAEPKRSEIFSYDTEGRFTGFETTETTGFDPLSFSLMVEHNFDGQVVRRQYTSAQAERETSESLLMDTGGIRVINVVGRLEWFIWKPTISELNFDGVTPALDYMADVDLLAFDWAQLAQRSLINAEGGDSSMFAESLIDAELDGHDVQIQQTFRYDEMGREVSVESMDMTDTRPAITRITEYSTVEAGEQSVATTRIEGGEMFLLRATRVKDAEGRTLSLKNESYRDGALQEEVRTWAYDAEGRVVDETESIDGMRTHLTHEYTDGLWTVSHDEDGDGEADRRTEIHLNDNDNRVLKREYEVGIEPPYYQKRYAYDDANRRVFDERDSSMNGEYEERWDYYYNGSEKPLWEVQSKPGTGCGAQ